MRNIVLLILLLAVGSVRAQSDVIINTVTLCIAEGRYNDGEKYLDSLLKVDPKNIDAMMMQGNLLLNYALMQTPPLNRITTDDESIYIQDLAGLKTPIVLIPKERAHKIEAIWKLCIQMDSLRLDIREGLCTLYGMADMRKELIDYLPTIARAGRVKGDEFVYALMQYALLLSERGDKEGAYEAYKKLTTLYPALSSTWCQLATTYQLNGDAVSAKLCADKAFAMPSADMSVCTDALDIYAVPGESAKALPALRALGKDSSMKVFVFYDGLYRYVHHDSTWRRKMQEYLLQFPKAPDSNVVYAAATYLLWNDFKDSYNDFFQLLNFPISDFYTALIVEKAMQDHKDSIQPYLVGAELMVHAHNYTKANAIYASLEKKKVAGALQVEYQLQYAFSLYCAGEYAKAQSKWSGLAQLPDATLSSMTTYFLGACALKSGNKEKAVEYFQKLASSKDETKYAFLSKLQLEKLGKK
jgi:hypothetical protein